jgi:NAD(P)-dependent dehydrogenase (short-subunit alcohol dehydrogenase family)
MTTHRATGSGLVSLVTGGGRGIGRSTVLALAERGNDVIFTYVSQETAAVAVVAEVERLGRRAAALRVDVGDVDSFDAFVDRVREVLRAWGRERIDHVIHNAGVGGYAPFEAVTEADFDALMAVHVKGPFFLSQKLLPLVADGGRLVLLSSGLSRYAMAGLSVYSAAKAAVDALARSLAVELGARRISINAVAPGGVLTDFGGGVMQDPALQRQVIADTPLGRLAQPDDIAGIIATLVAPETAWITGQRIEATGGYRL